MADSELFVVCKNCSAEVSPYVTECPYCGQRVRKRAPKLDKGSPREPRKRRARPRLPRLRGDEIPGIAPDVRPYATIALIAVSLLATVVARTTAVAPSFDGSLFDMGGIYLSPDGDWWRYLATPFLHDNAGYQFVALIAVGIFGTLIERRFGPASVIVVFLAAGGVGAACAVVLETYPALGANGAALGLLCAWLVDDRVATARGHDRGNDMLGVGVIAAVLLLLSAATESASIAAAVGGAATGSVLGLGLTFLKRQP
jgi:membrane associated rhomboid family serine protease